ncbi:thiamine-phosphate kinase, partial [Kaarinaea lacus]
MALGEFQSIYSYFAKQSLQRSDVVLGIGDDCALLSIPDGQQLAVSIDTLVAGVHYPIDTAAEDIGYKSLAVSLSDLAAFGAEPAWVTLAVSLTELDENWVAQFCRGFFTLAKQYNVQLIGGDVTRGHDTITTQLHGFVPAGKALRRSNAKVGDLIYVTGAIGEAGLALQLLQNKLRLPDSCDYQRDD